MIRRLLSLVIVAGIVYAGYHVGLSWFHYQQFKDGVSETALFGADKPDDALKDRVIGIAQDNGIDLDRDDITIKRFGTVVEIHTSYSDVVQVLPHYTRTFTYDVTGK